jgi:nucleoside-diphosphate-sugar epimerase
MNITITGASGFVGTNLIKYLSSFEIKKLSVRYQDKQKIDLEDADAVVHLSGKAHDLKNVSKPQDYYDANFELTKQLYDAFLKSNVSKFVFISSVKAAADSVDGILMEEQTPNPATHYGKSKLMAEEYIRSQPLPEEKSYYILRPCMIHGPGNKGNLNLLYKFVKMGIPYPLAAYKNNRSLLSVENFCFTINELLKSNFPVGTFNLADKVSLPTNEIVKTITEVLNLKTRLWRLPIPLLSALAKIGDFFKLTFNTERLNKLTENYVVSNQKIIDILGKEFPVESKEGLRKTIESFKNKK